jgi:hypothetical protein
MQRQYDRNPSRLGYADDRWRQLMIDIVTMHQIRSCFLDQGCEFAHGLARVDQRERAHCLGETATAAIILARHKMRRIRRLDIPLVLHREVDDFCPGARQERSFLKEHGLCATVVEKKLIGDQYFQWTATFIDNRTCKCRKTLAESCSAEVENSEVPTSE